MHGVEIWYHPNANNYWRCAAGFRYEIVPRAGYTRAQIIDAMVAAGATDRRPGTSNEIVGLEAMRAMESMTVVGATA
jgi:hypothetical protein